MGSIYVSWTGSCPEREHQDPFLGFLSLLADRSIARLNQKPSAQLPIQEWMTEQRALDKSPVPSIRRWNEKITGNIVLNPNLTLDGKALLDDVQKNQVQMIAIEPSGTDKMEAFCLNLDPGPGQMCLSLSELTLYGMDFELFDPRRLYPNANRISFVFLESRELPSLTGCLAQIEHQSQCRDYGSNVIQSADWYVSAPEIHLRYYLETWLDSMLAWVKCFYISDLRYERYEELSGFAEFESILYSISQNEPDTDLVKNALFDSILEAFESEVAQWCQES